MTAPLARHAHHRLGRINDGFPAAEPGHDGTARTPTDDEQAAACAYIDILVSHQAMPDLSRIGADEVLVLANVVVRRTMPDAMVRA